MLVYKYKQVTHGWSNYNFFQSGNYEWVPYIFSNEYFLHFYIRILLQYSPDGCWGIYCTKQGSHEWAPILILLYWSRIDIVCMFYIYIFSFIITEPSKVIFPKKPSNQCSLKALLFTPWPATRFAMHTNCKKRSLALAPSGFLWLPLRSTHKKHLALVGPWTVA